MRHVLAVRCENPARRNECYRENDLDRADRRGHTEVRELLGDLMSANWAKNGRPGSLDVVALLTDVPGLGLARGQVGTIVEQLDGDHSLVEFSDDQGRAYAIAPCPHRELLVLHYAPEPA
jgi:hypothetical protein